MTGINFILYNPHNCAKIFSISKRNFEKGIAFSEKM